MVKLTQNRSSNLGHMRTVQTLLMHLSKEIGLYNLAKQTKMFASQKAVSMLWRKSMG